MNPYLRISMEMDRNRGNSDRNDWGNCLSDGRYHRFLISDRISLLRNDRCTDRRFLYPSSGFLKKICMYPEHCLYGLLDLLHIAG